MQYAFRRVRLRGLASGAVDHEEFLGAVQTIKLPEPSKPELSPPEAPKGHTKALGIVVDAQAHIVVNYWQFFGTDYGKPVGCREDPIREEERPMGRGELVYSQRALPRGEFMLDLFGEKCTYKNSGGNAGKLFRGEAQRAY